MASRHPNQQKMEAAISGWIAEAGARSNGAELLAKKAGWVRDQIAILGREDIATPEHLVGLTVWDLHDAEEALERAARGLPARPKPSFSVLTPEEARAYEAATSEPERKAVLARHQARVQPRAAA
jgi:hypothetical protein